MDHLVVIPEPERAPYVQSIQQRIMIEAGRTPLFDDVARRREVLLREGTGRNGLSFDALVSRPSRNEIQIFCNIYMPTH